MTTTKRSRRARTGVRAQSSIERLERELPPTLAQFSRRMRTQLGRLERQIERTGTRYRRTWTRLLRDASHQLGRFEAEGEARWRRLGTTARSEALRVLRRLERELEPKRRRRPARRVPVQRPGPPAEATGSGI
jgi:hypothetical protein